MARIREEIVGKRFLSVSSGNNFKLSDVNKWDWRAGIIRACTHRDVHFKDIQILVEYDDVPWQRREWVHLYRDAFKVFLLEHTLAWAPQSIKHRGELTNLSPALVYDLLVDDVHLRQSGQLPVEHLIDRSIEFHEYASLQNFQDNEWPWPCSSEGEAAVRTWVAEQDGQRILCTTPSVLVGYRVEVYRSEGTTQWYTAVIIGYNETTRELTITDDTVLEEHSEDPSLVHIRLLGEGVVESILRGENVGVRRSRSASNNQTGARHIRRDPLPSRHRKTSRISNFCSSPNQVLSPPSPNSPISSPLSSPGQGSPLPKSSPNSIKSKKKEDSFNFEQVKDSPLQCVSPAINVNSPSSATNPDKPTNPRQGKENTCDPIIKDQKLFDTKPPVQVKSECNTFHTLDITGSSTLNTSDKTDSNTFHTQDITGNSTLHSSDKTDSNTLTKSDKTGCNTFHTQNITDNNTQVRTSETQLKSENDSAILEPTKTQSPGVNENSNRNQVEETVPSEHIEENNVSKGLLTVTPISKLRAPDSSLSILPAGTEKTQSVAGAVSNRAVTITATSGPAPQSVTRVASPPSVSITAVVRSPDQDAVQPRMECDGSSDSGVSVTERSVSRSSVLSDDRSSSAEVKPNTPTPTQKTLTVDRKEAPKVWRNPEVVSQNQSVRHIHSLQHGMPQYPVPHVPPQMPTSQPHPAGVSSIPPNLPYAPHHALPMAIQPTLAAAATLYPQLTCANDMWKIGHVGSPLHSYPGLLPRHQEEYYMERARELEKQRDNDRMQMQRERREAVEVREKMEREHRQREKEKERLSYLDEKDLVNQHFKESFRLASQKHSQWNHQALNNMALKMDSRNQPSRSHVSQHNDPNRKLKEPDQFVREGIFKAYYSDNLEKHPLEKLPPHPLEKLPPHNLEKHPPHNLEKHSPHSIEKHPPPAHSKHHIEKPFPLYGTESSKCRDNSSYHDKPSVIVQPEIKVQSHSVSPKHRLPTEKAYPGANAPFKYESPSPHRPTASHSLPHSVHGPNIHTGLEITKSRAPSSSPHSVSLSDRYFPPVTKSNVSSYSNIVGMNSSHPSFKAKVNSPPHIYGKPTSAPQVKVQPAQQTPLIAPPPAHSSTRLPERPVIPDHRLSNPHSPFDTRLQSTNSSFSRTEVAPQVSPQMQPLDLGTRESSSENRKRANSPISTECNKKSRTDSSPPVLSRVSEPSPLYFPSATTITTVENFALNLQRTSIPVSSSVSSAVSNKPSVTNATTVQDTAVSCTNSPNKITVQTSTANVSRQENNSSPVSRLAEPEKSNSPGGPAGYVHKLKKAWLQRHEGDAPTSSTNGTSTPSRVATPPPKLPIKDSKPPVINSEIKTKKPVESKPKSVNGHQKPKDADDSSSDSDDSSINKSKKKSKKAKKSSESDSDKESDGSESSKKSSIKSESKKRGRKPKTKDESKLKKVKEDPIDPLQKPPVSQLKKTGESFLQDKSCYEVAPKLPKCRECRWTPSQRYKKMPNIFCRFYAFRRLRYTKSGQLAVAGFSDPMKDAFGEDLRLWVPDQTMTSPDLDLDKSKFLLTHVGDQFCDLFQQEKEAMALHMGEDTTVAWKRVVQGVREMCDVCETTLFNIHWACSKCGFVVCIDCYRGRREGTIKIWDTDDNGRDKYQWLLCASKVPHEQDKLMLTQIIAGNALTDLGHKIHEIRHENDIPMYCGCAEAAKYKEEQKLNGMNEIKSGEVNGKIKEEVNGNDDEESNSPLNFFADVALSNDKRESGGSNSDSDSAEPPSTLMQLLINQPNSKCKPAPKEEKKESRKKAKVDTLDEVFFKIIDRGVDKDNKKDIMKVELKHFIRKYNYNRKGREPLPIRIMTKTESRLLYPEVPHGWLCDGKLCRLLDPVNPLNITVFQDQWSRGQPVVVSGVGQNLRSDLWNPASFSRDFGEVKNNLINCLTDNIVPNQPMKKFWDGFENLGKRLKDDKGQPMVLKLKDWPPGDDFAELLPSRFDDLMKVLPMGEYTRRNGSFNLAGRLPDCFVRPDLGPKMYIAYGSASYPGKASTNLHLDISDAVNVMCHVGIPADVDREQFLEDTLKAIDEAGCDILTRQRVREKEEVPGALWHIYNARDSDKIRDLLNKVAIERGKKLEPHHDPIHDQSWYLDGYLRERLYKEYNVEGYAIVQCYGDAVFIPAGAPHQVRNLQNCIKVAEDFVSPENVAHCFHLTQEFRHLSDTHTNHEDKLQIKNIIYHAMKDSAAVLISDTVDKDS